MVSLKYGIGKENFFLSIDDYEALNLVEEVNIHMENNVCKQNLLDKCF